MDRKEMKPRRAGFRVPGEGRIFQVAGFRVARAASFKWPVRTKGTGRRGMQVWGRIVAFDNFWWDY